MSYAGWIIVGLLLIIPLYDALEMKDKLPGRHRRSIMNLKEMVKEVTGRDGADFIGYGNWCGLGGSGEPLDAIDECCQNHDLCYDLTNDGVCLDEGERAVYLMEYKWKKTDKGKASCEKEENKCKASVCMCDAIIANCLKNNIESYDNQNLHKLTLLEMIREADWLTS